MSEEAAFMVDGSAGLVAAGGYDVMDKIFDFLAVIVENPVEGRKTGQILDLTLDLTGQNGF